MREVGGNTGGVDNIVEGELIDERGELQEQGQGLWRVDQHRRIADDTSREGDSYLSNTAGGASNNYPHVNTPPPRTE